MENPQKADTHKNNNLKEKNDPKADGPVSNRLHDVQWTKIEKQSNTWLDFGPNVVIVFTRHKLEMVKKLKSFLLTA